MFVSDVTALLTGGTASMSDPNTPDTTPPVGPEPDAADYAVPPTPAEPQPATPAPDPAATQEPPVGEPAAAEADAAPAPEPEGLPRSETLVDAIADLLQMAVNYLRQETAGVMRDKVVLPGQQLGMLIAFAIAAALTLFLGIGFVSVAILLVLAHYLGWPGALALIGVLLLIGAGVLTYLKVRSVQK
jgi:hypothetical protein